MNGFKSSDELREEIRKARESFRSEPAKPDSQSWWVFAPVVFVSSVTIITVLLCILVSAVAGTVWLVRSAFGV